MNNNTNILEFYKKRFIRIIPEFILVETFFGVIFTFLGNGSLTEWIWNHSLISFYTDAKLNEWFIASILLMYVLYPLLFYMINKSEKLVIVFITLIYMFFFLNHFGIVYFKGAFVIVAAIFITRIPAFLIGSLFAQKSMEGKKIHNKIVYIIIALGLISSAICLVMYKINVRNYWVLIRLLFIFVIFAVMFLWIMFREQNLEYNAVISTLRRFFSFLGPITLEIYLTHEKILGLMKGGMSGLDSIGLIYNVSAFAVSIVFSYFLHKLMNFSQKK